jgi:hypothetical protein
LHARASVVIVWPDPGVTNLQAVKTNNKDSLG